MAKTNCNEEIVNLIDDAINELKSGKSVIDILEDYKAKLTGCRKQKRGETTDGDLMTILNCSSLPELATKLREKINNNDYSGLRIGDYFDFDRLVLGSEIVEYDEDTQITRVEICGFNTYNMEKGILFQCKNIPFKHRMEATSINTDIFPETELGLLLNTDTLNDITKQLKCDLKVPENKKCKIFLPSSVEVFGSNEDEHVNLKSDKIWPMFAKYPQKRIKYDSTGDTWWWWNSNKCSARSGYFCAVYRGGGATCTNATNTDGGVPFAFYL